MERKTKIELSLAIIVILFFLGFLVWWKWPAAEVQVNTPAGDRANITTSGSTTPSTPTDATPVVPAVVETSPTTVARTFVERLGSYSSEADAANIEDILPMATVSFQKQLESLVRESRSSEDGSYYGISTIVITTPKVVSSTATQTVFSMTTQREETIDTPGNTTVKYQAITITLAKSGTTWLVDGYSWSDAM